MDSRQPEKTDADADLSGELVDELEAAHQAILAGRHPPVSRPGSSGSNLGGALNVLELLDRARRQGRDARPTRTEDTTAADPAVQNARLVEEAFAPGTRIGHFQLRQLLGEGGCGAVYLAYDTELQRQVALKLAHPNITRTAESRERFIREGKAAALLSHPNIVPAFETGTDQGQHFLVAGWVNGITLSQFLEARIAPIPEREAAAVLATLAEAVQHAHSKGLLHRDLKPANILLADIHDDSIDLTSLATAVRITDFGLARFDTSPDELQLTTSGAIVGTPSYMSPEQALGQHSEISAQSDIFSLGVMLYELLTLQKPFEGKSLLSVLQQVQECTPQRPRKLQPEISRDLEAICLKSLEKRPQDRYRTAMELYGDLTAFIEQRPVAVRPLGPLSRFARMVVRNPVVSLLLGATLAAILIGSGLALWQWQRAERNLIAARESLAVTEQTLDSMVATLSDRLRLEPHLLNENRRLLKEALQRNQWIMRQQGANPERKGVVAKAMERVAELHLTFGELSSAETTAEQLIDFCQAPSLPQLAAEMVYYEHRGRLIKARSLMDSGASEESAAQLRELLAEFSLHKPSSTRQWLLLAESNRFLGILSERRGQLLNAEQKFRAAVQAAESAPSGSDEMGEIAWQVASTRNSLAVCLKKQRRFAEAQRLYEQSLEVMHAAVEAHPRELRMREGIAQTTYNLGSLAISRGDPPGAKERFEAALVGTREIMQEYPMAPSLALDELRILIFLSLAEKRLGNFTAARDHLVDARKRGRIAMEEYRNPTIEAQYSIALNNLGNLYRAEEKLDEAEAVFLEALRIRERDYQLLNDKPKPASLLTGLGNLHHNLGQLATQTGDFAGMLQHQQKSVTYHRLALTQMPGGAKAVNWLLGSLQEVAIAHAQMGNWELANEKLQEVYDVPAQPTQRARFLATVNAQLMALATADSEAFHRFRSHALENVQWAISSDPASQGWLESPAFTALRNDAAFKKLFKP